LLSSARYKTGAGSRHGKVWRLAPALVGMGAAGMALTAAAATGSPNPAVWTERAESVIRSVGHIPAESPKAAQTPRPEPSRGTTLPGQAPVPGRATPTPREIQTPEPSERPEPSPRPEPTQSDGPQAAPTPEGPNHSEPSPSPGE